MPYKNPKDKRKWSKIYYQKNKKRINKKTVECRLKLYHSNPDYRNKESIRLKTRNKYGKLPKGIQYHHNPPYRIDVWLGVYKEEHDLFH